ncbi:pyridoxal kinase [Minwuia thermotolerans]|uniref:pyridoxal kinase n=1 Tax=Minwuia thermotolerans TaxID=2056226 RepID=A0A2M9FX80_9PROT|nr:pyridoxal kinase [Minwuia thermotolerans]PJK28071.1 pyridoxal kinase [Minwuia thermotolerans]
MAILSISSQVAKGHVGNSATAFALRRLGHEVWDVPTVVLSHHPGHAKPEGLAVPPDTLAAMVRSVLARGRPSAVFSGYLAEAANGETMAEAVEALRRDGPIPYVIDPILGDADTGVYVRDGVEAVIRDRLLPLADIVLPNCFELGLLAEMEIARTEDALAAARSLIAKGAKAVICTSAPAGADRIAVLMVTSDRAWRLEMPVVPDAPNGTGDLFAGVFMARWLEGMKLQEAAGHAAGAVHAVVAWSKAVGDEDLALVVAQSALADPPSLPGIELL